LKRKQHQEYEYKIENNIILKDYLTEKYHYSSRLLREIKREGIIKVNNKKITTIHQELKAGDQVYVGFKKEKIDADPLNRPLEVLYENKDVLVVNKPPFIATHPSKGHQNDTLANIIANYLFLQNQQCKIRFVNRLDRDTSGIVIIAKSKYAHHYIQNQMSKPDMKKKYYAWVEGILEKKEGEINAPIMSYDGDIKRVVSNQGKHAVTRYKVINESDNMSQLELELLTGRTHQIRVHCRHICHPIIGDPLYNDKSSDLINRQALHAREINFIVPETRKEINVLAPLMKDLESLMRW
jgi:23S rRNA pseudouridine1911/1915/1917 synthase